MITSKMGAVYFSLLALIIFCFHGNNGLLLHSLGFQCQINSIDTNCLLKRINEMNDRISRLEAKQGKHIKHIHLILTLYYKFGYF